jgi:UDP-glucuronate decarboxylase
MDTSAGVTGPINLGNPSEWTIHALADRVIELTGSRSSVEWRPLPTDDPKQRRPDIQLASSVLDWRPEINLDDGLRRTIAYFEKVLGGR